MKKLIIILSYLIFSISSNAQIQKAELVATGLTCSMCSNAIYKKLTAIKGVDSVAIDLNENLFTIFLAKDSKVKPSELKESVEKAGFFVGSLILTFPKENFTQYYRTELRTENVTYILMNQQFEIVGNTIQVRIMDKGYVTSKEYKKYTNKKLQYMSKVTNSGELYHVNPIN
ncbi:MAG: heavy-metal-associated domain-containing protein [Bacteroidetes bacterium]|jgi:copper chaperone CopZ|nr:heavy-metal-associated domain-containing protein [Bacteroidota bacterium]